MELEQIIKNDVDKIKEKLKLYIDIIIKEYGSYLDNNLISKLNNNTDIVALNDENTVSFVCRNGILYLPKIAYSIFPELRKHERYAFNPSNRVLEENYLDTNTTYFDYINHVIEAGLNEYEYFEESLLHEAMHLCGSGGGNAFKEGINELKTRELVQKYHIKIAAIGYSKEVELAKKFQMIVGKTILDELAFKNYSLEKAYDFLMNRCGVKIADLYKKILYLIEEESNIILRSATTTSDPFEKARLYSMIDYKETNKLIDEYIKIEEDK